MNSFLLNRQLGSISPQALANAQNNRLLASLRGAPNVKFALRTPGEAESSNDNQNDESLEQEPKAHGAGVNSITVDRFEGR